MCKTRKLNVKRGRSQNLWYFTYRTENRSVYFTFCNTTYYQPQQVELQLQLQRHRASHRALLCHLHSTTDSHCFNLQNGEFLADNETGKLNIQKTVSLFHSVTAAFANAVTGGNLVHLEVYWGTNKIFDWTIFIILNPLKPKKERIKKGIRRL
jgi:hypothetical protein